MHDKYHYLEYNIVGLILLIILFLNIKSTQKKLKYDGLIFLTIIFSIFIIIILDILMTFINGETGYLFREVHILLTTTYFVLNVIPYIAWSLYVDFHVHKNIRRNKKLIPFFAIPAVFSVILCLLSAFNGRIFFITENNFYQRGDLFYLNATLYYSYCFITYIQILTTKKKIRKKDYHSLLSFGIIPIIAGILQSIDTSKSFLWLGLTISALIIYLNIQNSEINEDYLTGLYNRRQLDQYLEKTIQGLGTNEYLLMIMLDLNYFKSINDTYGHIEGDRALQRTAEILTNSLREEDLISRYAGDEFIIIVKLEDENDKEEIVYRIKQNFKEFNESGQTPYEISISIGYDIYNPQLHTDADDFIRHTDELMYRDKLRIKEVV